jgi:hypothetical protein
LGGGVALFVLIIVGVVVAQTWVDWRDTNRGWVVPDWAKGVALGGTVAVSLAAAASYASVLLGDSGTQSTGGIGSGMFWIEFGVLLTVLGMIVLAARYKRFGLALAIACVLAIVVFLGLAL